MWQPCAIDAHRAKTGADPSATDLHRLVDFGSWSNVAVSDGELIAFAQRVLALLDGGRRVSTYKLAVLLSLMDCATLGLIGNDDVLKLKDLADRVVGLYWPQVRPAPATGELLRQSEQSRAAAVDHVVALRDAASQLGARTLGQAELMLPEAYENCVTGPATRPRGLG